MHNPPHPGILLEDYLGDISLAEAARRLGVTESTLSRLREGQESVSNEMAARLGTLFGTSVELWLGLQADYDHSALPQRGTVALTHDGSHPSTA